jgi:tRNA (cytosine38-C5)-methyltransferase
MMCCLYWVQVDLVSLTAAELDAYAADLWLLAPPCQPFTRQGKQLAGADARSSSFMHFLQQLQHMQVQCTSYRADTS